MPKSPIREQPEIYCKKAGYNYQGTDYDYNFILTRFFHCNYFVLNYLIMITLSVYIFRSILISDKLPLLLISSSSDFSAFFFRYTTQRKHCNFIGKFSGEILTYAMI